MNSAMLLLVAALGGSVLPQGSALVPTQDGALHVRTLGAERPGPAVVLLSGPTESWHSDTAWFALLQALLADSVRTHAIDRAGQAFSDGPSGSYASFGRALSSLLPSLEREPVFVIAFASANLALHGYFAGNGPGAIAGALLVDPDALSPGLLDFYAEQAVPFQSEALPDFVLSGGYDARAAEHRANDRARVLRLADGPLSARLDASYLDAVLGTRSERQRILWRFQEIAHYGSDVRAAAAVPWPVSVPVWSFDTDFERAAIEAAAGPEERATLSAWRQGASDWMDGLPGSCRIVSTSTEHLAVIAQAPRLRDLILALRAGAPCPAATR
ncbi:MAG: alpha/beta hydrolase [Pseudomonadales bacterium]